MEPIKLSKARKVTTWIFVGLMSALFIMSALMKLMAGQATLEANWDCREGLRAFALSV